MTAHMAIAGVAYRRGVEGWLARRHGATQTLVEVVGVLLALVSLLALIEDMLKQFLVSLGESGLLGMHVDDGRLGE